MILIAGLGNPDKKYARTRHNIGFEAIEFLKDQIGAGVEKNKFHSMIMQGKIGGEPCILCRPLTYMNQSGIAIREIADFYKIAPEDIIVIYDDVALPIGALRVRANGSAGGHNGMKSIIAHLGTQDFPRIRIGVGEKPAQWDLADYVLGQFTDEELPAMREACDKAGKAVQLIVKQGVATAMNRYNQKPAKPKKEPKETTEVRGEEQ